MAKLSVSASLLFFGALLSFGVVNASSTMGIGLSPFETSPKVGGFCHLQGERAYVDTEQGRLVLVCEMGIWELLYIQTPEDDQQG